MITWEDAYRRAVEHVAGLRPADPSDSLMLDQARTREHDFGWTFVYNSRRFLEAGETSARLVGNVPFIVDRRDGSIHPTRTNWREAVAEYSRAYRAGPV